MANWRPARWEHHVKIKQFLSQDESYEAVKKNMAAIADVLAADTWFCNFNVKQFRRIPKGDKFFKSVDYANRMLDELYDYADANRIWIE